MTKAKKTIPKYEERLCLFLDILGFKNIIANSVADKLETSSSFRKLDVAGIHAALRAIDRAVKHSDSTFGGSLNTSKQVTQFSDSIVISYLMEERSAVFDMLYDIFFLQIELVQRGILVRGAITSGPLFHDANTIFGPALVEAAELEKLALYPRVILHQEIIDKGRRNNAAHHTSDDEEKSIRSLLKQDLDGMYYIDYFSPGPGGFDEGWDGLYEYLVSLRENVRRLSYLTKNPSLRLKHSWMRQKFNEVALQLEKSKYKKIGSDHVPDDLEDHIHSIAPFR